MLKSKTVILSATLLFAGLFALSLSNCGGLIDDLQDKLGVDLIDFGDDKVELTGNNAFLYMKQEPKKVHKTDAKSVMKVIDIAASGGSSTDSADTFEPGQGVVGLMKKSVRARNNTKTQAFKRVDFNDFATLRMMGIRKFNTRPKLDTPSLKGLKSEYVIPTVDAIPVRNQGSRGTCAAFTGIGHLEYAVVEMFPQFRTFDLSEQRFYYLSKTQCWTTGCGLDEQGSWYGSGMEYSMDVPNPTIPLEADCPYDSRLGKNDLQVPQEKSCETGALRVVQLKYVRQPQEIIKVLENEKLPVPWASPLSGNWERNKGLITFKDSNYKGSTGHAGGHAYLIVGYRLLPNMPEEGGICFIIKNSWDVGWGVNGYSCMTLEWMKNWTFGYDLDHPVVVELALRDDILEVEEEEAEEYFYNPEEEDELNPYFNDDIIEDETADMDAFENEDDNFDIPEPEPAPVELTWKKGALLGPGDKYYKMEYAENDNKALIRSAVRKSGKKTGHLELTVDGKHLVFDGDRVGERKDDEFKVCTGEYDILCSLRFNSKKNKFYIQFLNTEYRKVKDKELPDGKWNHFVTPVSGYAIEYREPDSISDIALSKFAYIRLMKPGKKSTEPLRMKVDKGEIKVMGTSVGSYNPKDFALCTGKYSSKCSIFAGEKALEVLPSW